MSIEKLIEKGSHDGRCEWCDRPGMTDSTVVEGDLGFYCSSACAEAAQDIGDQVSDAQARAWERRQMGLTG